MSRIALACLLATSVLASCTTDVEEVVATTDVAVRLYSDYISIGIENAHETVPCVVLVEGLSNGNEVKEGFDCPLPDAVDDDAPTDIDVTFDAPIGTWDFTWARVTVRALRWGGDPGNPEHWITAVEERGGVMDQSDIDITISAPTGARTPVISVILDTFGSDFSVTASLLRGSGDEIARLTKTVSGNVEADFDIDLPSLPYREETAWLDLEVCIMVSGGAHDDWLQQGSLVRCEPFRWYRWTNVVDIARGGFDGYTRHGSILEIDLASATDTVFGLDRNVLTAYDEDLNLLWSTAINTAGCTPASGERDYGVTHLVDVTEGVLVVLGLGDCATSPFGVGKNWYVAALVDQFGQVLWRQDLGTDPTASAEWGQLLRAGDDRFGYATCDFGNFGERASCTVMDIDLQQRTASTDTCVLNVSQVYPYEELPKHYHDSYFAFNPHSFTLYGRDWTDEGMDFLAMDCQQDVQTRVPFSSGLIRCDETMCWRDPFFYVDASPDGVRIALARPDSIDVVMFDGDAFSYERRFDAPSDGFVRPRISDLGRQLAVVDARGDGIDTYCTVRTFALDGSGTRSFEYGGEGAGAFCDIWSASSLAAVVDDSGGIYQANDGALVRLGQTP
jgi:hypothetical protein